MGEERQSSLVRTSTAERTASINGSKAKLHIYGLSTREPFSGYLALWSHSVSLRCLSFQLSSWLKRKSRRKHNKTSILVDSTSSSKSLTVMSTCGFGSSSLTESLHQITSATLCTILQSCTCHELRRPFTSNWHGTSQKKCQKMSRSQYKQHLY